MIATTKQVGWAYPTSDTAHDLGYGKVGCYFVLFLSEDRHRVNTQRRKGFPTVEEAFAYADTQPEAYDFYSLRPDESTPWIPAKDAP